MRSLLLATALILSQWLLLAHANEHVATVDELGCEICVHAERSGDGPALPAARVALAPCDHEPADALPSPLAPRPPGAPCSIRGPPEPSFPHQE